MFSRGGGSNQTSLLHESTIMNTTNLAKKNRETINRQALKNECQQW